MDDEKKKQKAKRRKEKMVEENNIERQYKIGADKQFYCKFGDGNWRCFKCSGRIQRKSIKPFLSEVVIETIKNITFFVTNL